MQPMPSKYDDAPTTDSEKLLAAAWQEVLGIPSVLREDNFFDIGGQSVLLMRVIARIERETGKKLQPTDFTLRSLWQIARVLDSIEAPKSMVRKLFAPFLGK